QTLRPLGDFQFVSRLFGGTPSNGAAAFHHGSSGNRFADLVIGGLPIPVPADYLIGIDMQKREFESGFRSYLHAEMRYHRLCYYYFYALAVKIPLALWGLIGWNILWTAANLLGMFRQKKL